MSVAGLFEGRVAVWHKDLTNGAINGFNEDMPLVAASVIKLFIMAEAFRQMENGRVSADDMYTVSPDVKMPSCGALTYMHDGLKVTLMDLVVLMIILSDNTATNMLIDILGMDSINEMIGIIGAEGNSLNRKLFDAEASARGVQNYITARGVGRFFEMIWDGELVSREASAQMLSILKDQRLNGKIPFFLDCKAAHKTGEDDGITHDAGIVLSEKPFILVMLSNEVDVPRFERFIQDAALDLCGSEGI